MRYVGTFLLGAVVALACLAVHRRTAGQTVPWGVVLAAASSWVTGWWLRTSHRPRGATSYAAGWLALFTLALVGRPEGDYVLAADLRGYALMAVALGVLAVGLVGLAAGPGRCPER